jgi:hypothetical protein
MSVPALLDVNVLVALFDADHIHHETAHDWFADHRQFGWATCSITENGFVRVAARVVEDAPLTRPSALVERLQTFQKSGGHRFWPDSVSLTDARVFHPAVIRGHRQVTDIYLLGLAKTMGGCLVTFDQTIPLGAVVGATRDTLQVISK